jgi:Zn-dependent protease
MPYPHHHSTAWCIQLPLNLTSLVIPIAIVLLSLTVHEAAHAWTADRRGDPTARMLGRISLNPIVHIDLIGTIILPLVAAISNWPIIGWAKPVPVNIMRLRHPRRDFVLVAAAGPISNLLQATVAGMAYRIVYATIEPSNDAYLIQSGLFATICVHAVQINILLALFNLIPVPPLDGGNVLAGLLPPQAARVFISLRPFGFIILYLMMFSGMLSTLIVPPAHFLVELLLP